MESCPPQLLSEIGSSAPRPSVDWGEAERRLAMKIPSDYRDLVNAGGAGLWFGTIRVYRPGDPLSDRDLLSSAAGFEDLEVLWEMGESPPVDPMPADARLIEWASTTAGHVLYWWVEPGLLPERYPVYVGSEEGSRWEKFDFTTSRFLLGILSGRIESRILTEITTGDSVTVFRPYKS